MLPVLMLPLVMSGAPSDVRDVVGDVVERRVAVHLVAGRLEERVLLVRARRGDVRRADHPDADALVAAGVQVTGVVQGHLGVGGVQAADVDVVQPALAAQEYLVQRPTPLVTHWALPQSAGTVRTKDLGGFDLGVWPRGRARPRGPRHPRRGPPGGGRGAGRCTGRCPR